MFSLNNWRDGRKWSNWSESYSAYPGTFYAPTSIEEVSDIVKQHVQHKKTIRVTGAAHSFSPIAMPEQSALSLHHLRGLIRVGRDKREATFYAGTYLHEVGPILAQYGLALINMGDIQQQTLAGAISTGTHGTGITLGSFSSMVTEWGFVNGQGDYVVHRRSADALSEALHVSVGLLGILVTVTIAVVPIYSLHYRSEQKQLHKKLATFTQDIREHRHVEWYYFPGSEVIQVKTMDLVPVKFQTKLEKAIEHSKLQLVENGAFFIASELCRRQPALSLAVSKLSSTIISQGEKTGVSYEIYPTPRSVKFVETEYAIPLAHFEACMEEVHAMFKSQQFNVHFPVECRTTAGEVGYLSPTQGQESAFLAFHMYKGMDERAYFKWVHDMMVKYNGRPHWGKMNTYDASNIDHFYPNTQKFNEIRQQQDPSNIFLTTYFKRIFTVLS